MWDLGTRYSVLGTKKWVGEIPEIYAVVSLLAALLNTVLALVPMELTVAVTINRITASIIAYSAMSCPRSSFQICFKVLSMESSRSALSSSAGAREITNHAVTDHNVTTGHRTVALVQPRTRLTSHVRPEH